MSQDYVDLNAQQVANGLGKWDQVAGTLDSRWKDLTGRIDGLLNAETWGGDTPGAAFAEKFDGPAREYRTEGATVVARVVEAGQNVRTACEASLGADNMQAAEVGGVNVPGFNTSGGGGGSSAGGGGGGSSAGGGGGGSSAGGGGGGGSSAGGGGSSGSYSVGMSSQMSATVVESQSQLVAEAVEGDAVYVPEEGQVVGAVAPGSSAYLPAGSAELHGEAVPGSSSYAPADQSGTPSQLSATGQPLSADTVNQFPEHAEGGHGGSAGAAEPAGGKYTIQPAPEGGRGEGGPGFGGREDGDGSPRHIPEGLAEHIRGRIDHLPDRVFQNLPDGVIQNLPDGVIQQLPEGVIQQLPEGVVEQLPEGATDKLSDAGSPHIPLGKHTDFIPPGDELTGRPDVKAPR